MNPISIDRNNKFVLGYTRSEGNPKFLASLGLPGGPIVFQGFSVICCTDYRGGPGYWVAQMGLLQDE